MTGQRKPAAFRVEPEAAAEESKSPIRPPRAIRQAAVVIPDEVDIFDEPEAVLAPPPPVAPARRGSRLGRVFIASFGVLVSLAVGLWVDGLVRELFQRADWLGWLAAALAAIAGLALLAIVLREALALRRLASVERIRARAQEAAVQTDQQAARNLVDELSRIVAANPETAAGRRQLDELRNDIIDGPDLIRLAETELLVPLDMKAQTLVLDAAKRVSLITAVSPRAMVDVAYVVFEAARLIRRISELYGGRPGTFGFIRLARTVLAHLAVTGSIAVGDSFVQQIVGHGLAARLSAKLGEGVVNGMMTARIGLAAMEAARPLPYVAARRPGMGDFLSALTRFTSAETKPETTRKD